MSRLFAFIQGGQLYPQPPHKVIPSSDFTLLLEAHELLEKARQEKAETEERAAQEAEACRKKGYDEGYQAGLEQFNAHIMGLENEKKRLRHEMNQLILPLALKAAKKIVASELQTHPETIVTIVLQALAPVMQNRHITLYVNKKDKELLETEKPRLKEKLEHLESFLIKERDDIAEGGCVIETESGIINATLENQWQGLEAAFERYLKS